MSARRARLPMWAVTVRGHSLHRGRWIIEPSSFEVGAGSHAAATSYALQLVAAEHDLPPWRALRRQIREHLSVELVTARSAQLEIGGTE